MGLQILGIGHRLEVFVLTPAPIPQIQRRRSTNGDPKTISQKQFPKGDWAMATTPRRSFKGDDPKANLKILLSRRRHFTVILMQTLAQPGPATRKPAKYALRAVAVACIRILIARDEVRHPKPPAKSTRKGRMMLLFPRDELTLEEGGPPAPSLLPLLHAIGSEAAMHQGSRA